MLNDCRLGSDRALRHDGASRHRRSPALAATSGHRTRARRRVPAPAGGPGRRRRRRRGAADRGRRGPDGADRGGAGDGARARTARAGAVIVAAGATELVLPFPGWDLPGVTTVGAAQALLKSQGVTVGRRVSWRVRVRCCSQPRLDSRRPGSGSWRCSRRPRPWPGARAAARLAGYPGKLAEAAGYAATLARHRVPIRPVTPWWPAAALTGCSGPRSPGSTATGTRSLVHAGRPRWTRCT